MRRIRSGSSREIRAIDMPTSTLAHEAATTTPQAAQNSPLTALARLASPTVTNRSTLERNFEATRPPGFYDAYGVKWEDFYRRICDVI